MKTPRCALCLHPGGHRRRLNARKPSCSCACHCPPPTAPVREHHRWPNYVPADIEFEEVD